MSLATYQNEVEHLGESAGLPDHDHDMIHDLSRRLDMLWRYDQYMANASTDNNLLSFWGKVKAQETENISELKQLIASHIERNCF